MKKLLGKLGLKILGWKIILDGDVDNLDRCILVVAPHTDNLEYILGNLAYWVLGKKLKVIIKDDHTKAWYGFVVKSLGGIGIDRSQRNDLINFVDQQFQKEDFSLVITPEGTRSWAEKWKKGFYLMALKSRVPVVLGAGDFGKKEIHIGKIISVHELESKTFEEIMAELEEYYKVITPRVPKNWNPKIY